MRTGALALVVAAMSVTIGVPGAEARTTVPLGGGFSVVEGTELVGAVFPQYLPPHVVPLQEYGWYALLSVHTDAATVVRRFDRQAERAGYAPTPDFLPACETLRAGEMRCRRAYLGPRGEIDLHVRVCPCDGHPVSGATVRSAPGPHAVPSPSAPAPTRSPTSRLSNELLRRAERMPTVGDRLLPEYSIRVKPGSRVLGRAQMGSVCEGDRDLLAVFSIGGRPTAVAKRYLEQVFHSDAPAPKQTMFEGRDVTLWTDGYWAVTQMVVRGRDKPLLAIHYCG